MSDRNLVAVRFSVLEALPEVSSVGFWSSLLGIDSMSPIRSRMSFFVCDTNITEPLDVIHESEDSVAVSQEYKFQQHRMAQATQFSEATTVKQIDKKLIKARTLDSASFSEALSDWRHCPQANKPVFR
jgi:hypothetical protein